MCNNINSHLDATIIILLIISISKHISGDNFTHPQEHYTVFTACGGTPPHPGDQQAASSMLYTTNCKHSLVLLRMGEIIARNILS
jgi:hypothetical protein